MLHLLLALSSAGAAEVVVFGDSWAEQAGDILGVELRRAGYPYDVVNVGVGGTTAAAWNDAAPTALVDAVTANPDARWVWLSILGNDTFGYHFGGQGAQAAALNEAEITEMVDRLLAAHPDIKVVSFAYDYVNYEQSQSCKETAWLVFSAYHDLTWVYFGLVNTPAINEVFVRDVADVQARVAATRPGYDAYRFFGTLQAAAGQAPSALLPSPASLMRDCIHASDQGYGILHDALIASYWDVPPPTAAISGAGQPVCAEHPHTLTATASAGSKLTWWVDGEIAGHDATLTLTPDGGASVRLRADRAAWRDEDTATLTVRPAPVVDAGEDVSVCAGSAVMLEATGGAIVWSPTDGLDHPTRASTSASPTTTTTYVATSTVAADCSGSDDVVVTVLPVPEVLLSGPVRVEVGEPVELVATVPEGTTPRWTVDGEVLDHDGATLVRTWDASGRHEVVVAAEASGCEGSASWAFVVGDPPDTDDAPDPEDTATPADDGPGVVSDPYGPCGCAQGPVPGLALLGVLPWLTARRRRGGVATP